MPVRVSLSIATRPRGDRFAGNRFRCAGFLRASLCACALAAVFAGCAPRVDVRGNLPDPTLLSSIKVGEFNREQVEVALGSPSTSDPFGGGTWFYVSQKTHTLAFMSPEVVDRKVVAIHFDDKGVVNKIDTYGLADAREITPAEGKTPTSGNEMTLLQQLIGNLGRFNSGRTGPPNIPGLPP